MFQPTSSFQPVPPLPHSPAEALPPEALQALDALFGEGRVVAHRPCFGRLFGGAACGVLLSQFWFWAGTPGVRARPDGWFWKPQREITAETGLSRAETETARRRLCAQGVLEEKRCGIPAVMHFRVDLNVVMRVIWRHLQAQNAANKCAEAARTALRETRTLVRGNVASKFAGIAQTTSEKTSETLSEKTQEITQTRARPVLPSVFADRSAGRTAFPDGGTFREVRVTAPAVLGAVVRAAAAIGTAQQAVNFSGLARLKAAMVSASQAAPRPTSAAGRAPPAAAG